eukprot:1140225-Pelagomonas_calceolata.AAC.9
MGRQWQELRRCFSVSSMLTSLATTTRDGRNLMIPYHPPPLQTLKHTTLSLDSLTRRSATSSGKIQRLL